MFGLVEEVVPEVTFMPGRWERTVYMTAVRRTVLVGVVERAILCAKL